MKTNIRYTETAVVEANGIKIAYDSFGEPDDSPMLLVMGLGAQLIGWDNDFCAQLAGCGFRVIRFDNRDAGLSTKFPQAGVPNLLLLFQAALLGEPVDAPYTLSDMAADAFGLLDFLGLENAHVVGASMGGMIAQTMAIEHPERLRSLTSIMSTTSDPSLPLPEPEILALMAAPVPVNMTAYVERSIENWRAVAGPIYATDEERIRERSRRAFERSFYPGGTARQAAAIAASGSRREALKGLTVPTLVIHGDADPLVPLTGGIDTAESIPDAKLLVLEGMGHDFPPPLLPQIVEAIVAHAAEND